MQLTKLVCKYFEQSREEEFVKSQIEAEGKESEERRAQFANVLKEEEQSKRKEKEALLDDLVRTFFTCAVYKPFEDYFVRIKPNSLPFR